MQPGARRRARNSNAAVSGSVWETRMKMDAVKGGIKVFNGGGGGGGENEAKNDEDGVRVYQRLRRNQSDCSSNNNVGTVERKKRRNWKPPESVADKNPVQLRKARSEIVRSLELDGDEEEEEEDEIEIEEGKNFDDKEIDIPVEKPKIAAKENVLEISTIPISTEIEMKQEPVLDLKEVEPDPVKPQPSEFEEETIDIGLESTNRLQNIVDLVMWRDISKSAFVFGFGTFILLSSSYTKDFDFSLLSAISYLGLVYLALIFLYKSILRRGGVEFDERENSYIIGEEEAIWILRFLLPYINEVLIKVKALFSGDPATTMKLAVLLFVMARCGSSITLWTLAKLVFFGIFTIPKVLSSYSVQLARHGKFWLERFRDGWDSCTHKKAAAAAVFILIWNISSTVARVWAVFMLVVAVKLYQQCAVEWNVDDEQQQQQQQQEEQRQEDSRSVVSPQGKSLLQNQHNQQQRKNGPSRVMAKERDIKVKKWT